MSAFKSAVAAAVLLALPAVHGEGFTIKNNCPFNVYYKVTADQDSAIQPVASGAQASMPYTSKSDGGGPSVKVSANPAVNGDILQMEYTMAGPTLFYDISNIDGLPFGQHNVKLGTNQNCPQVLCAAGQFPCGDAYNVPSDNAATKACQLSGTDTTLTLCSDESNAAPAPAPAVTSAVSSVVQAVNNVVAAAPTTLSTSVVAQTTPKPAPAPVPAPAPAPAAAPAPVPVAVNSPAAPAPSATSDDSSDEAISALHFPASWGQDFANNADNFDELQNMSKTKRSSRVHRHHAHLAASS